MYVVKVIMRDCETKHVHNRTVITEKRDIEDVMLTLEQRYNSDVLRIEFIPTDGVLD